MPVGIEYLCRWVLRPLTIGYLRQSVLFLSGLPDGNVFSKRMVPLKTGRAARHVLLLHKYATQWGEDKYFSSAFFLHCSEESTGGIISITLGRYPPFCDRARRMSLCS
jgi:hypothetical protein